MNLELTDLTAKEAINNNDITVIDFYTEWCMPCKMVGPIIKNLAEKFKDAVKIGKVDIDENNILASEHGVRNIPTVLFFKDGKLVDKQVGVAQESAYEEKINKLLNE